MASTSLNFLRNPANIKPPRLWPNPKTFSTPEIRVDCSDEEKFEIVKLAAEYFQSQYPTFALDGVRIDFGDGWGLVRASNTQPVLVTRFEANTEKRLLEIQGLVEAKIREFSKKATNR